MTIISYATTLIFESEDDKNLLIETLYAEQKAFNAAAIYCHNLSKLSIVELHSKFYRVFRETNPDVPSQIVIKAENSCLSAYRSIRSNRQRIDIPIKKKRLSLSIDKRLYSYKKETGILRLTTLKGRIPVIFHKYKRLQTYLDNYEFGDPTIFVKNDKVYIAFSFKVNDIAQSDKPKLALGIDVGVRRFAATSNGQIYQDKNFLKRKRELRHLKRSLQSKDTKSSNKHLKKVKSKERNFNKNFINHLANAILKNNPSCNVIVVEDLNLVKMKKKKYGYQNKSRLSQVGMGELIRVLQYKAGLQGKVAVKVNPFNTSRTDPITGKVGGERRGCRFYSTSGLIYDADCSAAINIAKLSQLPFSCVYTLDGQAVVNRPIV